MFLPHITHNSYVGLETQPEILNPYLQRNICQGTLHDKVFLEVQGLNKTSPTEASADSKHKCRFFWSNLL
jgi:hypothetical protein